MTIPLRDSFSGLDVLKLGDHGDARERDLWPKVAKPLSHYEPLWRTLIVLLTNRIVPSIPVGNPDWFRMRSTIPCAYEELAMHNYSLFYFMATARQTIDDNCQRLALKNYPHPERTFFALQAAVEHSKKLQNLARNILFRGLGMRCELPKHPEPLYRKIGSYRNAFVHNPVLGSVITNDGELVPPETSLPKEGQQPLLWRNVACISRNDMIDGLKLEDELWQDLSAFLQKQWLSLAKEFGQARERDKFITDLELTILLPIHCTVRSFPVIAPGARSDASY